MSVFRSLRTLQSTAALALCILPVLAGCGSASKPVNSAKPYAGTTIRVLFANHPWTDAVKPLLAHFQQQTGITVKAETYGETQLSQKLTVEFVSGNSDVDVFMNRPLQDGQLFQKNGWYTDLKPYVTDSAKTPADYDFSDFSAKAVSTTTIKGKLTAIPVVVEHEVLYYRKDLLQKAGLQVPKTLDELQKDAVLLNAPGDHYGFIARGMQAAAVTQFSSYLYSEGGDWFDPATKKATLTTPQALAAFNLYGKLLHDSGPPGVVNMNWPQAVAVFAQGKAALYTDADSIYNNVLDPGKSRVATETGIAPFPAGPNGSVPYAVVPWSLSMSATAPHKGAAWEFIKWVTSKSITRAIQGGSAVPEARTSVYKDPAGVAKFPADFVATAQAEANGKSFDRPYIVQVVQARDIIGTVIVASIQGQDVTAAADKANTQFQALLDKEP
ncbi:MAG TPA: sugar ABC transporter substrate-binding protein [Ktedonobacterales bacterium]